MLIFQGEAKRKTFGIYPLYLPPLKSYYNSFCTRDFRAAIKILERNRKKDVKVAKRVLRQVYFYNVISLIQRHRKVKNIKSAQRTEALQHILNHVNQFLRS